MKKNIQASVGKVSFTFEEDAYESLSRYLHSIENHFSRIRGGQDVVEDIERRVAELLGQRLKAGEVVTLSDAQAVMDILGEVEEITGQGEEAKAPLQVMRKRLYRDTERRVLGGVCAGLGAFLGLNPLWLRLGWLVLFFFFGTGLLLYLIFWIVVPAAVTPAEKLEMQGKPVDLRNLSASLGREMEGTLSGMKARKRWEDWGEALRPTLDRLVRLVRKFLRLGGTVISGLILLLTFFLLVLLIQLALGEASLIKIGAAGVEMQSWSQGIAYIFPSAWQGWGVLVAVFIFILIPLIILAARALAFLFQLRFHLGWMLIPSFSLWLLSVGFLIWSGVVVLRQFSASATREESLSLKPHGHRLHVQMDPPENLEGLLVSDVRLHIFRNASDSLWRLTLQKTSYGFSRVFANSLAEALPYEVVVQDARLHLPQAFVLPQGMPYRGQSIELFLYVPEGGLLTINPAVAEHLAFVPNLQQIRDEDMHRFTWVMTAKGLSCADCP
ncbi:MAG: PspC domain-containing protein [Flavobacteriales bacterium]|nr:PspC domain-containing protein [Flavobacteriales bacterium]MDW8431430.1 PspC domain-containing protein [Flavobacteriales bacterium]